ncbi:MAG: sigma-70 family RNA polymerase sigma factor [Anaerolineae bacterium]
MIGTSSEHLLHTQAFQDRLAAGDERAFEAVFRAYYGRVFATAYRLLGCAQEADDVAQEAFLRLYRRPLPAGRQHNLLAWLLTVATHQSYNALRGRRRRQEREDLAGKAVVETEPTEVALSAHQCEQVRQALARLPERQAQMLLLRQAGLSYAELAAALVVAPTSVGTLLARAEKAFQEAYEQAERDHQERDASSVGRRWKRMMKELECLDEGNLRAYIDQELPAQQQAAVAEHLAQCDRCSTALTTLRSRAELANSTLSALPDVAPPVGAAWERFRQRAAPRARNSLPWRLDAMWQSLRTRALRPVLSGAAVVALTLSVAFVAPLRTAASQFLDIFRVRTFMVVSFNPDSARYLQDYFEQVFGEPRLGEAKPQPVASVEEASRLVGYPVLVPGFLPKGRETLSEFTVTGARQAEADVNVAAARALFEAAGLPTDALPAQDMVHLSARVPPQVTMVYGEERNAITVVQADSPEVDVPQGLDLRRLGELGLRLLGQSPEQAQRLAESIDWATTLVIPVPANVASVREVLVRGNPGYLFEANSEDGADPDTYSDCAVIWQESGRLYAVIGMLSDDIALRIAESLQ